MNVNILLHEFQQSQRAMLVAVTVFGIILTLMAGVTANQWVSDWILAHQTPKKTHITIDTKVDNQIAAITSTHLFGQSLSANDLPLSSLQFQLTGIALSPEGNETHSKAYISVGGAPAKIYVSGDSLPYGVKVYRITNDAVVLENNGRLEKLALPREKLIFNPPYEPMRNEQ